MQACTHFEQHHKPMGIKAEECLCHIQRLLWQQNQWVIGHNNRCCIWIIYQSHWEIISCMAERNNFLWRVSVKLLFELRFNSCAHTGSLNSCSLDGSTFENAPKSLFSVCWSKHDVHFWSRFKGADWSHNARLQWCFIIGRLCVVRVWWNVSSHQHPVHYLWWHVFFNLLAGSFQSRELLMRHDRVGEAGKTVACFIGS